MVEAMSLDLRIFGEADEKTVRQMENCLTAEDGAIGVLCADNHLGYSQPIGGAVAYRDHVSVSGAGYDIGCGNRAVLTDLTLPDVEGAMPRIMDEITDRLSFGVGRENVEPVDHPILDRIENADFPGQRQMADLARSQLGTAGSGNHYVDIFADEKDRIWVGVHFGSRGFGHRTASGFLSIAFGGEFDARPPQGEMMSPPVLFPIDSERGQAYLGAMNLAGDYARAGREIVADEVVRILGAETVDVVENHHNFARQETHQGEEFHVVRKGCTPAHPGQRGFVGATMGDESVVLEGTAEAEVALFSTIHGAGRVMSRTQAAGRFRWGRVCPACGWVRPHNRRRRATCANCGTRLVRKRIQVKPGEIDFESVQRKIARKGIELRGAGADEAPGVYKRLDEVIAAHGDQIRVLHRLRPLGVAMAPADTFDPYKD